MKYRLRWQIQQAIRTAWRKSIGFRLALWMDKKLPAWCWADICTTVGLGYDIWHWRKAQENSCAKECAEFGSCWCGKMRKEP